MRSFRIATTAISVVLVLQTTSALATSGASQDKGGDNAATGKNELAPEINLAEIKSMVDNRSAFIIDANAESTYDKGHIPTAVSYVKNKTNFAAALPKDKSALLVAYCGGPRCTAWEEAAKVAKNLGYTNIKHFKGGLKGWTEAGYPVAK
jgi:rhodanese-related sulfurtransferase